MIIKVLAAKNSHRDYCLFPFGPCIYPLNGDLGQQVLRDWGDALVRELSSFPSVRSVRISPYKLSISKAVGAGWYEIDECIRDALAQQFGCRVEELQVYYPFDL